MNPKPKPKPRARAKPKTPPEFRTRVVKAETRNSLAAIQKYVTEATGSWRTGASFIDIGLVAFKGNSINYIASRILKGDERWTWFDLWNVTETYVEKMKYDQQKKIKEADARQ